jgi:hypothetical protein
MKRRIIVMESTPLLMADPAAFVFHGHFVGSEIDVVEPKSGFMDGGRGSGAHRLGYDPVFFRRPGQEAVDVASKPLKLLAQ